MLAVGGRSEIVRPQSARAGLRRHGRIVEPHRGDPGRIGRPVGPHLDALRRNAERREHAADFAHRIGGGDLVAGRGRHLDQDAAGRLAPPGAGERRDVGALRRRQAAALAADEQLDRAYAFLDGDRMAQAVVVGETAGDRRRGVAAGERGGASQRRDDARRRCGRRAIRRRILGVSTSIVSSRRRVNRE